ncbi:putative ribonuclease H-like domain-containing protein [Tanacetum coccineum]
MKVMQEELLQFKIQKVWILVDLPFGKREIRTKWVYKNKKDERGVVVRNKARIEVIRIFLSFASYIGFIVYQMDVKSAFLYGTIDEEVYVSQPLGFVDPKFPKKVYKVVKALYGLHQAPRKKIVPDQEYILLPLLTSNPSLSKSSKDSPNDGFKPSGEEEKIDSKHPENKDSKVPNTEEPRVNQEQDANVNGTNNINTVSPTFSVADIENNAIDDNIVYGFGAEADMNNLATTVPASPIPTTRVHKDHPLEQITGDIHSAPQTIRMKKNVTEHVEPKKVIQALTDPSWIEAIHDELLQFKLQKVWTLFDLPYGKRTIGTKWVYRNKKDDRVARIKAIRLFLAYASFMNFIVYQMDVKSAFLYGTIKEQIYVCQPPGFEDLEFPNKIYKVEKALYDLHQAPRAWCM